MTATWQVERQSEALDRLDHLDDRPHERARSSRYPTVVVALDGQPASTTALEWARHHLVGPDHRVVAVTAYVLPMVAPDTLVATADVRAVENTARVDAERAMRAVFGSAAARIHHVVEAGEVEQLLERHADDDTIVVAGAPERRRLLDRLRPSVGRRLAGRFHCPVVIVPEHDGDTTRPSRLVGDPRSGVATLRS